MGTRAFLGVLALVCALAFVGPADAAVIGGVDYKLFARCKIGIEQGGTTIDGNVKVSQICGAEDGFLQVGTGTTINGTASANKMSFGSNVHISVCEFNINAGGDADAACDNIPVPGNPGFTPDPVWPPAELPVPVVTPGTTNFTCPSGQTCNVPAGQYKAIRAHDGATLVLDGGLYEAVSLLVEAGATLNGNNSTVNLTGNLRTEPGAKINDVNVTSVVGQNAGGIGSSAEAIVTANGTIVKNSVFYVPFARIHLRQNGVFENFEGIAVHIIVQPVTIDGEEPAVCACIGDVTKNVANNSLDLTSGCHLNASNLAFFVATTCPTDPIACPGCTAATRLPGSTDSTASLTIPVVAPGVYRVVVQSTGGSFCTADTVSLP